MATDKSQGLPVQPTEIEGINNEAQAAGRKDRAVIVKDICRQIHVAFGQHAKDERFGIILTLCEVKGNKTPSHSFDYWAVAKIFMDMKQARTDKTFWQKSGPQKLQGAFPR